MHNVGSQMLCCRYLPQIYHSIYHKNFDINDRVVVKALGFLPTERTENFNSLTRNKTRNKTAENALYE